MDDDRVSPTPEPAAPGLPPGAAGPGSLAYAIERWEAAHPGFVRYFECTPVVARPDFTQANNTRRAKRLGIAVSEYEARVATGQRYCTGHADWHDETAFNRSLARNPSQCSKIHRAYKQKRRDIQKRRSA